MQLWYWTLHRTARDQIHLYSMILRFYMKNNCFLYTSEKDKPEITCIMKICRFGIKMRHSMSLQKTQLQYINKKYQNPLLLLTPSLDSNKHDCAGNCLWELKKADTLGKHMVNKDGCSFCWYTLPASIAAITIERLSTFVLGGKKHNTEITILKLPACYTLILFLVAFSDADQKSCTISHTCKVKLHFCTAKDSHLVSWPLGAKTPKQSSWFKGRTNHLTATGQDLSVGSASEQWSLIKVAL